MKKILIAGLIGAMILFAGCSSAKQEIALNIPAVPDNKNEKVFYTELSDKWIKEENHDLMQMLDLYRKLIELYPVDDEERQKMLRHILDRDLKIIFEEKKAEEGLKIALELDKIIPSDFYIQNRIIGAYRIMAENAMAKKDYKIAEDILQKKALSIRFDIEAMRTFLNLRILQAEEELKKGNKEKTKQYLEDALMITGIEENKPIYAKERGKIEAQLAKMK